MKLGPRMEHRVILTLFVAGFCIIFFGSIFFILGQTVRTHADIDYRYRGVNPADTADALDNANVMTFVARILIASGAFTLAIASTIGAWTIEDKYMKLGMLFFSALVTVFLLAPSIFTLTI